MKINIMNDFGITFNFKQAFLDGILEMIQISKRNFEIQDLGLWRNLNWKSQTFLAPFNSVDWYVSQSMDSTRNQVNAQHLLALFYCEPWQDSEKHIDLFITNRDLFVPETNFVLGLALANSGMVISGHRFSNLSQSLAIECLKTLTMNKMGHVLGIVPEYRTISVEESLGKHCTNQCIMRQGLTVQDWVQITKDRLNGHVLCDLCQNDLLAISHFSS